MWDLVSNIASRIQLKSHFQKRLLDHEVYNFHPRLSNTFLYILHRSGNVFFR